MRRPELGSLAAVGGLLLWVRYATGMWLAEILTAHLPQFVKTIS